VFARRAARRALEEPSPTPVRPAAAEALTSLQAPPRAEAGTREALWREAGVERDREGLERLAVDPHPLARLIAGCALERRESRGAHRRTDHPERDPDRDQAHVVVDREEHVRWETWG
jgi:L-aspartate oxidase